MKMRNRKGRYCSTYSETQRAHTRWATCHCTASTGERSQSISSLQNLLPLHHKPLRGLTVLLQILWNGQEKRHVVPMKALPTKGETRTTRLSSSLQNHAPPYALPGRGGGLVSVPGDDWSR